MKEQKTLLHCVVCGRPLYQDFEDGRIRFECKYCHKVIHPTSIDSKAIVNFLAKTILYNKDACRDD